MNSRLPLLENNLRNLLVGEPSYRFDQVIEAFLKQDPFQIDTITGLAKSLRNKLRESIEENVFDAVRVFASKKDQTCKALMQLYDGKSIESVLMPNPKKQWTVCLSSQVGCSMGCRFCATGEMGRIRNLDALEIAGQVAYWNRFIKNKVGPDARISNLVFMGMGEPLLNYETVRDAINWILKYTDIGPNYITLSTVGLFPHLFKLLEDKNFPSIKIAISLHAPTADLRKRIVPTHQADYFKQLKIWCEQYTELHGARTRPLTLEYVMLGGVNDDSIQAKALVKLLDNLDRVKVNLIPYNVVPGMEFRASEIKKIENFQNILKLGGIPTTIRFSKGQDIAGACGQLAGKQD